MSTEGKVNGAVFIPNWDECSSPFAHKQALLAAARLCDTRNNFDHGLAFLTLGPEKAALLYPGLDNYDFNAVNHPGPAQVAPAGAGFAAMQTFFDTKNRNDVGTACEQKVIINAFKVALVESLPSTKKTDVLDSRSIDMISLPQLFKDYETVMFTNGRLNFATVMADADKPLSVGQSFSDKAKEIIKLCGEAAQTPDGTLIPGQLVGLKIMAALEPFMGATGPLASIKAEFAHLSRTNSAQATPAALLLMIQKHELTFGLHASMGSTYGVASATLAAATPVLTPTEQMLLDEIKAMRTSINSLRQGGGGNAGGNGGNVGVGAAKFNIKNWIKQRTVIDGKHHPKPKGPDAYVGKGSWRNRQGEGEKDDWYLCEYCAASDPPYTNPVRHFGRSCSKNPANVGVDTPVLKAMVGIKR